MISKNKKIIFIFLGIILIFVLAIVVYSVDLRLKNKKNPFLESIEDINKKDVDEVLKANQKNIENIEKNNTGKILQIEADDLIVGNKQSKIELIVYTDFECPFSSRFNETLKKVKENYKEDEVVIAFRHFYFNSHQKAYGAALAFECASEQGKTWEMNNLLFENSANNLLEREQYLKDVQSLQLDVEKFSKCFDEEKFKEKILAQIKDASQYDVIGTPTAFINKIIIPGAYPFEDFEGSQGEKRKGLQSLIEENK